MAERQLIVTIQGTNILRDLDFLCGELELPRDKVIPYTFRQIARSVRNRKLIDEEKFKQVLEESSDVDTD